MNSICDICTAWDDTPQYTIAYTASLSASFPAHSRTTEAYLYWGTDLLFLNEFGAWDDDPNESGENA